MKRARTVVLVLLLLAGAGLVWSAAYRMGRANAPPPPPPLPPQTVTVEVVKEIPVPVEVEGPARVVERVQWRTREVEVPVEVVRSVLVPSGGCDSELSRPAPLEARVSVHGWKFEGLNDEGELAAGWRGTAICEIAQGGSADWTELVAEPFSLTESSAESTVEPGLPDRLRGFRQSIDVGYSTDGFIGVGYARRIGRSRLHWSLAYEWGGAEVFSSESCDVARSDYPRRPTVECVTASSATDDWRLRGALGVSWGS